MTSTIHAGDLVSLTSERTVGYKVWAPDWSDGDANAVLVPGSTAIVIQLHGDYSLLEFVGEGRARIGWVSNDVLRGVPLWERNRQRSCRATS